jgi:hypothetical protein
MKMKQLTTGINALLVLVWLAGLLAFFPKEALAQTDGSSWSEPVNLSQSGGAINSTSIVDSSGRIHVVWSDAASVLYYTRSIDNGVSWSPAIITDFPFGTSSPYLLASRDGTIHAFWIGDRNQLFYSRTPADAFGTTYNWDSPQTLAEAATDISFDRDEIGNIYLAYIRPLDTQEAPSGVYIRRLPIGGGGWTSSTNLFASRYIRNLTASQANVNILAQEGNISVSWDLLPRKQIFSVISRDSGNTWGQPELVAGPDPISTFNTPFNITSAKLSEQWVRIWEVGQPGVSCERYYQFSSNVGESWSEPERFANDFPGCIQKSEFHNIDSETFLLLSLVQGSVYFSVWNGVRWSDTILQADLGNFVDPDTYDLIELGCHKSHYLSNSELLVTGCDTANSKDIWVARRTINNFTDWFPEGTNWVSSPGLISSGVNPVSPLIIPSSTGNSYVIWADAEVESIPGADDHSVDQRSLFFASWESERWSTPARLNHIPETWVASPVAATQPDGRVHLVWQVNPTGALYYSWANTNLAITPVDWSEPYELPIESAGATNPAIAIDSNNNIYIAYSVPANENRGIYLMVSSDSGRTWSAPTMAFDGVEAGWEIIGSPQVAVNESGIIHILFTQKTLTGTVKSLHYLLSNNRGDSWSPILTVVDGPIIWSQLTAYGMRSVHRAWLVQQGNTTNLIQEFSFDGGQIWQQPSGLFSAGEGNGAVSFTWDIAGRLHFLRIIPETPSFLRHQIWVGDGWRSTENVPLPVAAQENIAGMSAAITPNGFLSVIYLADIPTSSGESVTGLAITSNQIVIPDIPIDEAPMEPITIPTTETSISPEEETVNPTPTLDLSILQNETGQGNITENSMFGVIIGSVLAFIVIAIPFGIQLHRNRFR